MSVVKKISRRRLRGAKTRYIQQKQGVSRIVVYLSNKHSYVQLISPEAKVLVSASTAEKEVRGICKNGGNQEAAEMIGRRLAQKAKDLNSSEITKIGFDRNGFRYAGRVKKMAEAMRSEGMLF